MFFKVNVQGLCSNCERIEKLEYEEANLKKEIDDLQIDYRKTEQAYKSIKEDHDTLYNKIAEQAKNDIKKEFQETLEKVEQLQKEITEKRNEVIVLDESIMLETFALHKPKFKFTSSAEYKEKLEKIRGKQAASVTGAERVSD